MRFSEYLNVLRAHGHGSVEERAAHDAHYGTFVSNIPSQRTQHLELKVFNPLDDIAAKLFLQTEHQLKAQGKIKEREALEQQQEEDWRRTERRRREEENSVMGRYANRHNEVSFRPRDKASNRSRSIEKSFERTRVASRSPSDSSFSPDPSPTSPPASPGQYSPTNPGYTKSSFQYSSRPAYSPTVPSTSAASASYSPSYPSLSGAYSPTSPRYDAMSPVYPMALSPTIYPSMSPAMTSPSAPSSNGRGSRMAFVE